MGWGIEAAALPLGLGESWGLADLRHGDRHRGTGGHAPGQLHQRCGAGTTGEGHHQHRDRRGAGAEGHGLADRQLEQLAIADRPGSAAIAPPISGEHFNGPAQLTGGAADGAISPARSAMEKPMHELPAGAGHQGGGNLLRRPEEIAASTGNHHATSPGRLQRGDQCWRQQGHNRTAAQGSGLANHRRV